MRKQIDHVNHQGEIPALDLLEQLHGLMHALRARQLRDIEEADLGVNPMEGKVLGFFARHPEATSSDLAAHSGRDKGQLARLIGSLRERNLLEATPDETDRRVVRLRLSAAARQLYAQVQQRREALAEESLRSLSPTERRQLAALLKRLQDAL